MLCDCLTEDSPVIHMLQGAEIRLYGHFRLLSIFLCNFNILIFLMRLPRVVFLTSHVISIS